MNLAVLKILNSILVGALIFDIHIIWNKEITRLQEALLNNTIEENSELIKKQIILLPHTKIKIYSLTFEDSPGIKIEEGWLKNY